MQLSKTHSLVSTPYLFFKRLLNLVVQPVFISLAVMGNSLILSAAVAFYFAEKDINPKIHSFLDVLWWSVATATTVGYGDVSPMTVGGKWIGIVMMLLGATLFCSFTALFSSALMSGELNVVEKEMKDLRQGLREIESEVLWDEKTLDSHLSQIENILIEIRNLRKNRQP